MNKQQLNNKKVIWEEKNLTEQSKNSESPAELDNNDFIINTKNDSMPKQCENIGKIKKINWNNPVEVKERQQLYNQKNKEKIKLQRRLYYINNKQKEIEYANKYNSENKEKIKEARKLNKHRTKEYDSKYRLKNREKIKLRQRFDYKINTKKYLEKAHRYNINHREKINNNAKIYRKIIKNKENRKIYNRNYNRIKNVLDVEYKIKHRLRNRLNKMIHRNNRTASAISDLGCSMEKFKKYIESKFKPGMTWDNYGNNGWHFDHIRPLVSFNLTIKEELLEAVNYTNLQPLWATSEIARKHGDMSSIGNLEKGNKIILGKILQM